MKRISEEIPAGFPRLYLNDSKRPTFAGVLEAYFDKRNEFDFYISDRWDTVRTVEDAIEAYCNAILPCLPDRYKPLDMYEEADFLTILSSLEKEKGYDVSGRGEYYKRLLWKVYQAAVENIPGFVQKIHWDGKGRTLSSYSEDYSDATEDTVRLMLMPKSFTIDQEVRILKMFRDEDVTKMDGIRLGLFLMFFLGARNEEAVSLSWDDIISPLPDYPEKKAIVIHTSYKGGQVRTIMKTRNAYRIIPLYSFFARKLEIRRKHVMEQLGNPVDEKIPIACIGDDYLSRAEAEDLTKYARGFLRKECGSPSKMSALSEMIEMLEKQDVQIGEKEPSAYLMRRAFGTHLRNLGLEPEEIEYLMGHRIENDSIKRYHIAATDSLQRLFHVFEQHPFSAFFNEDSLHDNQRAELSDKKHNKTRRFVIMTNEPCDPVFIRLPEGSESVKFVCSTSTSEYGNEVDISGIINPKYIDGNGSIE